MKGDVESLYNYDEIRQLTEATLFDVHVGHPALVLGSSQSPSLLSTVGLSMPLRRRRGGGGIVLVRPGDVWVDWWLPANDPRWSHDVHASALQAGRWWAQALSEVTDEDIEVHDGALTGSPALLAVCFAGRGPGEAFIAGRKVVGVTQWRVREGLFLSTVLPVGPTRDIVQYLAEVPAGLDAALAHHHLTSLALIDSDLVARLVAASGTWQRRTLTLF